MKYVNPDSPHPLDLHSEDRLSTPSDSSIAAFGSNPRLAVALALGLGAVAFFSAWAARRGSIRSLNVRELKIDRLEVGDLHVKNHERASSMEETGGILRFDLGGPDVFENGLE